MPLWGTAVQANNAPRYKILSTNTANGETMYANVTISAFEALEVNGVYNVNSSPQTHTGWTHRVEGAGPVSTFVLNTGGTGFTNADVITISGGTVNATANVVTNANGTITTIVPTAYGAGFKNLANTVVAIATANGTTANVTVTLGGRAGRVSDEVLVAL